jgi:hypothetical protein
MFIGGLVFMILNFIASKYNHKHHKTTAFFQDFLGGSIFIALLGAIIPDYFPQFPISSSSIGQLSLPLPATVLGGGGSDFELQIGPIKR